MEQSLRLEQAFECPKCRQNILVRDEDDPNVAFLCPNSECGYIIWTKPPQEP